MMEFMDGKIRHDELTMLNNCSMALRDSDGHHRLFLEEFLEFDALSPSDSLNHLQLTLSTVSFHFSLA